MKRTLVLPDTIKECHAMIISMARQIEQLERRAFGSLKDRAVKYEGPSLFDELDEEARLEAAKKLSKAAEEVDKAAQKRREESREQSKSKRPEKYNTYGLPEEKRVEYPQGINPDDYDVIGTDVSRILHLMPQKLWVEVIERPILRKKSEKDAIKPAILQSQKPHSIIGGGHVGADVLATMIDNKNYQKIPNLHYVTWINRRIMA